VGDPTFDSELQALRAGDEAAFQALIQRYHGPMFRLAMTYVRDRGVAEDVVQESWLTTCAGCSAWSSPLPSSVATRSSRNKRDQATRIGLPTVVLLGVL
jgi:DNA-directed RNA polymerase specialized sigma24 family protein